MLYGSCSWIVFTMLKGILPFKVCMRSLDRFVYTFSYRGFRASFMLSAFFNISDTFVWLKFFWTALSKLFTCPIVWLIGALNSLLSSSFGWLLALLILSCTRFSMVLTWFYSSGEGECCLSNCVYFTLTSSRFCMNCTKPCFMACSWPCIDSLGFLSCFVSFSAEEGVVSLATTGSGRGMSSELDSTELYSSSAPAEQMTFSTTGCKVGS